MTKLLIGLDIGSQTIKAVQLNREKNSVSLLSAGYIPTAKTEANPIPRSDEQPLANSINQLIHDMKVSTNDTVISLPSYKVITQVIEIPALGEKEIESSIQWEAEQYIPLPLSKVKIDYSLISVDEKNGKMKIILVAAPIVLIEKYMRIVSLAGLNPVAIETEILADCRSISQSLPTLDNVLLLSIGATSTELAVIRKHVLFYTKSYPIGGNILTRAISEELGLDADRAEEYKKTYGIEEDKLDGKLAKVMSPFFTNLYSEIEKTATYIKEQFPGDEINTLVVSGGTAQLRGLMLSITKNIGMNSQSSSPFINLNVNENVLATLNKDAPVYTTAVGLALKEA